MVSTEVITKKKLTYGTFIIKAKLFPESHDEASSAIAFIGLDGAGNEASFFSGFDGKKSDDMSEWTIHSAVYSKEDRHQDTEYIKVKTNYND